MSCHPGSAQTGPFPLGRVMNQGRGVYLERPANADSSRWVEEVFANLRDHVGFLRRTLGYLGGGHRGRPGSTGGPLPRYTAEFGMFLRVLIQDIDCRGACENSRLHGIGRDIGRCAARQMDQSIPDRSEKWPSPTALIVIGQSAAVGVAIELSEARHVLGESDYHLCRGRHGCAVAAFAASRTRTKD